MTDRFVKTWRRLKAKRPAPSTRGKVNRFEKGVSWWNAVWTFLVSLFGPFVGSLAEQVQGNMPAIKAAMPGFAGVICAAIVSALVYRLSMARYRMSGPIPPPPSFPPVASPTFPPAAPAPTFPQPIPSAGQEPPRPTFP